MPDMFEIYQKHAPRYHALVLAEDHENHLGCLLHQLVNWQDLSVLEAGTGTGRVTRLYIGQAASAVCCDQSQHMLDFAQASLAAHAPKITFQLADNTDLPVFASTFEVFIEGWSFGHSIMDCGSEEEIRHTTNVLLANATENLSAGSTVIIIETLGTNVDAPAVPHERLGLFYETLVHTHGFSQHAIRTDYRFNTNEEAAEILGFFFGDDMRHSVLARGTPTIPEWTGIWAREF